MRGQAAHCTQLSRCGWVEPREAQNAFPTDKKRITDSFKCQPPGDWGWASNRGFIKKHIQSAPCLTIEIGSEEDRTTLYTSKAPLSGKFYPIILNQQPSEYHRDEQEVILAQFPLAMHSKRLDAFGTELTDSLMVHRLRFLKDCSPFSQFKDQDIKRLNQRTWAIERGSECKPSLSSSTFVHEAPWRHIV